MNKFDFRRSVIRRSDPSLFIDVFDRQNDDWKNDLDPLLHFCSSDNQEKLPYLNTRVLSLQSEPFQFFFIFLFLQSFLHFLSLNESRKRRKKDFLYEGKNKLMHTFFKTMNFCKKRIYCKKHCNVLHIETDFGEICFNVT